METTKRTYQKHKTAIKITVKYFLNTELKPEIDKQSGLLLYPLYVRISVNRQLTKFKSRLNHSIPLDDLEELLNTYPTKQFTDNERFIIEQTIREMKPEQKANFKLKDWSDKYKSGLYPLSEYVSSFIMYKIIDILRDVYQWGEPELRQLNSLTIPEIFSFLSKVNIQEAKEIEEQYGILLKTGEYEHIIQIIREVEYDFCLWDAMYGFFQAQVIELCKSVTPNYIKSLNEVIPLLHTFNNQD